MSETEHTPLDIAVYGGDASCLAQLALLGHRLHCEESAHEADLHVYFLDAAPDEAWDRFAAVTGPKIAVLDAPPARPARADALRGAHVVCGAHATRDAWGLEAAHVIWPGLDPLDYPPCLPGAAGIVTVFHSRDAENASLYGEVMHALDWQASALGGPYPNTRPEAVSAAERVRVLAHNGIYFAPGGCSPLPRAMAEAMLCGLAPVALDSPEMRRVITNSENGFLAAAPRDLAALLAELVRNAPLRAYIGKNARATALRQFHLNHFLNAWDAVIAAALAGRPPAAPVAVAKPAAPPLGGVLYVSGPHPESATTAYRVYHAQAALAARGIGSRFVPLTELSEGIPDDLFAPGYEFLVCHRLKADALLDALLGAATRAGALPVYETDDLVFDPIFEACLTSQGLMGPEDAAKEVAAYRGAVARFEHATCTNAVLQDALHAAGVPNVAIIPNVLDEDVRAMSRALLRAAPPPPKFPILGYASGSATHEQDFALIVPVLARILAAFPQSRLQLIGEINLPEALVPFGPRVRRLPLVHRLRLPALLARLAVNLAPLEDTPFCRAKSALKYFEAAAVRVPTVATPAPAFRDAIVHGETGMLASSESEWEACLGQLLEDSALRARMGQRALDDTESRYTRGAMADAMVAAFSEWRG